MAQKEQLPEDMIVRAVDNFSIMAAFATSYDVVFSDDAIVTLTAIAAKESGLSNVALGRNWENGTPADKVVTIDGVPLMDPKTGKPIYLHNSLGLGLLQHDSGWLRADTIRHNVQWSVEDILRFSSESYRLLLDRPGMARFQGLNRVYVNYDLWMVYPTKTDRIIDHVEEIYRDWRNGSL